MENKHFAPDEIPDDRWYDKIVSFVLYSATAVGVILFIAAILVGAIVGVWVIVKNLHQ